MASLVEVVSVEELGQIDWLRFADHRMTEGEFRHILGLFRAFWMYQEAPHPGRPHALLTSGLHSDGFIDLGRVLKVSETFLELIAWNVGEMLCEQLPDARPDVVVGSATSATRLAEVVARHFGALHRCMEKVKGEHDNRQEWISGQSEIGRNRNVLHVEELATTASSTLAVREGIEQAHPWEIHYLPIIPVVVDRSDPDRPLDQVEGLKFVSLFQFPIRNFLPNQCPYCVAGSEAIAPKGDEGRNWSRLLGMG